MGSRQPRRYANLALPRTRWDLRVELHEEGLRLDQFLAKRVKWKSRNEIRSFVTGGQVSVNDEQRKLSTRLHAHDRVAIAIPQPEESFDPATIPLHVIHDDGRLLVLNKQPGIVVHPTGIHQLDNLLSALHARYRRPGDPEHDRVPHVCHRIDMHTSGVFLVAFDEKVKRNVSLQFEKRTPRKEYVAIVHGVPEPREGVIDAGIRFTEHGDPRLEVHAEGLPSTTEYRVQEAFGDVAAVVRYFPRTGRTHQIRVHSAWRGHPLLGDVMYGGRCPVFTPDFGDPATPGAAPLLDRYALHAARIDLVHPDTGRPIAFEAPLPDDMVTAIAAFRARWA